MDIITRAAAGLPSPSVLTRKTTPWAGITWHHTGGGATTWKAIHDWQTAGRPEGSRLVYIGYSYGIGVDGRVTELRGWDYRAAGDHENSRLQVVFMGNWASTLPPAAALNAALEFAHWAEAKAGRPMPGVAHRDVWDGGQYDTDCPGNALYAWVRDHLLTIGDDDMTPAELLGTRLGKSTVTVAQALQETERTVRELAARPPVQAGPVDAAALKAVLLDPEVLSALAKAVVDEDHRRSAE